MSTLPVPRRRTATDVALAGLALLFLGLPSLEVALDVRGPGGAVQALAAVAMPITLAARRSHPTVSAALVYALALAHWTATEMTGLGTTLTVLPVDLTVLAALYSVTVHGRAPSRRLGLGGAIIGSALAGVSAATSTGSTAVGVAGLLACLALVVTVWAIATQRRSRVDTIAVLTERNRAMQAERDRQVQLAAVSERSRIAREMHDVVAHSLSVVIAQADGGRYAAAQDPDAAVRALETISEMGRGALADMRSIIGVLREDDQPDAPRRPQPIDDDLEELAAHVREAGTPVSIVRIGTPRTLPPGTGMALHRLAQEALTNVLKYAGPAASATVRVEWHPDAIELVVDDDGRGVASAAGTPGHGHGHGHGIVGMRERAAMFGGTLDAGPRPGGGFRVRAVLPTSGAISPPGRRPGGIEPPRVTAATATSERDALPAPERPAPRPTPRSRAARTERPGARPDHARGLVPWPRHDPRGDR